LRWQGAQTLNALTEKGIQLYAIIGAAGVIEAAADYVDKRYTFDDAQQGQTVRDWHELMTKLAKSGPDNSENNKKK
jgi:L-rhamnose mutarotase